MDLKRITVLGGELAVPCNSQPAIVGLNSLPRLIPCSDRAPVSGVDGWGPAQRALCESRQDREVAAVAAESFVLQDRLA